MKESRQEENQQQHVFIRIINLNIVFSRDVTQNASVALNANEPLNVVTPTSISSLNQDSGL